MNEALNTWTTAANDYFRYRNDEKRFFDEHGSAYMVNTAWLNDTEIVTSVEVRTTKGNERHIFSYDCAGDVTFRLKGCHRHIDVTDSRLKNVLKAVYSELESIPDDPHRSAPFRLPIHFKSINRRHNNTAKGQRSMAREKLIYC